MKRRHSRISEFSSTSFITTTIVKFIPIFSNEILAQILLNNIRFYVQKFQIQIHGYVIMPNHLHILLTAEKGSEYFSATKTPANRYNNISRFIGLLKQFSAKEIIDYCIQNKQKGLLAAFSTAAAESKQGHKYQVWQKRFHDEAVSRDTELITKLNYIHNNPLQEKWGLCEKAEEYQYSSARHYNSGEDVGIPIVKIV